MKKQEPVFRTPMTYSPRLVGNKPVPSPSRQELWRRQLGFDDIDDRPATPGSYHDPSSDTDTDHEDSGRFAASVSSPCSLAEYHSLQKELDERNKQRDDLLLQVKTLTDKNKQYRSTLTKEENSKKQQLGILRKTHQTQLDEKDDLIQTLKELLEEHESRIEQLGKDVQGNITAQTTSTHNSGTDTASTSATTSASTSASTPASKLVEKVASLQDDKLELTKELVTLRSETELHELQQNETIQNLQQLNAKLEKENAQLHDQTTKHHHGSDFDSSITGLCTTDTEKQLEKVQAENNQLTKQISGLRKLSARPSSIAFNSDNTQIQLLQEENETLRTEVSLLQDTLDQKETQQRDTEIKHRSAVMKLSTDNQALSRQLREIKAEMVALQAREPEVMHQIERVHVEVESDTLKQTLRDTEDHNSQLQNKVQLLQQQTVQQGQAAVELRQEKEQLLHQLASHQSKNHELQVCMEERLAEMEAEKQLAVRTTRQETEAEMAGLRAKCLGMCEKLVSVQSSFDDVMIGYIQLQKLTKQFPTMLAQTVALLKTEMVKAVEAVSEHNKELVKKYHREMSLRKKYHNELVELKGNIRVFCRVRPCIKEDGQQSNVVVTYDRDDDGLIYVDNKGRCQTFEMDRVFTDTSTQIEVFEEVKALVTSCIDGFNVCIFAYGQTGSGKTYTMEGPSSDPGINQRALQELFRETSEKGRDWQFTITVSVVEIYNENLRDLLNNDNGSKLEVKMNPDGGFHVPGLTQYQVATVKDVNKVFAVGQRNRATATTNMNEHSSRSHALLCVTITGVNKTTNTKTVGKLNLVDLAGSERVSKSGADGARLKEAQNINKSLSCLGDVIHALRSKQNHVPYRNSRLTYLLQDSLGGDSKTLMIVQVAPVNCNVSESTCSLNFAQRVRSVELGAASKRIESNTDYNENGLSSPQSSPRSTPSSPLTHTPGKSTPGKLTSALGKTNTPVANGKPGTPTSSRTPGQMSRTPLSRQLSKKGK
ncbi:kinesin-like protein KIFC3 isoform X1 [Haliotis rubra]|uniref:kinesin-like protein KIFC3 isoform X1 n=1 Tax=Haliotis rubra TaxID=36100 RepID=UPI001EE5927D|nr:kinesin-like protein KIFC3 isoform X1 [Haliotis rubra]